MIRELSPSDLRKAYDLIYEYGLGYFKQGLSDFEKKQVGNYAMKIFKNTRMRATEFFVNNPEYRYPENFSNEEKIDHLMSLSSDGIQAINVRNILIAYNSYLKGMNQEIQNPKEKEMENGFQLILIAGYEKADVQDFVDFSADKCNLNDRILSKVILKDGYFKEGYKQDIALLVLKKFHIRKSSNKKPPQKLKGEMFKLYDFESLEASNHNCKKGWLEFIADTGIPKEYDQLFKKWESEYSKDSKNH